MSFPPPTVSVILPFFNAEKTLDRAIESISNQTFKKWECILINNNSTDKSCNIAIAWTKRDSRFILVHEKQQGVMFASNKGSKSAKGKYIARMDADDVSLPKRLEMQSNFLDNFSQYGAVSGLVEYVPHHDNTDGFQRYVNWVNSVLTHQDILNNMFVESPIVNPTAMWRFELAQLYGMYKHGNFPEDYELWLRWLSMGVKIKKIGAPVIKWFDSETRLTRTHPIYNEDAFYSIKTQYLARWLESNNPHYPLVAIWGASRISRGRTKLLQNYGIEISYYIDTKKTRQLDREIVYFEDIPLPGTIFILVYIKNKNAKMRILKFLKFRNYIEGEHFIFVS
jgi:glycosyltransferase involved in cell wall biosynthesis